MAQLLLGPDRRQERITQIRLVSRVGNAHKDPVRKAIRNAMREAASAFEDEGRAGITPAVTAERERIARTIEAMHTGIWDTLGGRVLRAAKSLHGREWKQTPEEEHREALRQFIAAHSARRVSQILDTTGSQVARIIERSEREGLGVREVAKRIRRNADQMSRVRSEVIARTETHTAGQAAQDSAARVTGVANQKEWVSANDDRTRDDRFSHVDADGETISFERRFTNTGEPLQYPGDPAGSPGNTVMCFTPDTAVRGRFEAGTRVLYDGDVLRVQTRAGRSLSVTPNHPLLTAHGLKPAHLLGEGDNLVTDGRRVEHASRVADHDRQHGPAPISEVFRSLSQIGAPRSVGVRRVDLHGDGVFGQGNIDIVEIEGHLVYGMESALAQRLDDLGLVHADPVRRVDVTRRDPALGLERALAAAHRIVRRLRIGLALGGRHALHAIVHRLTPTARFSAAGPQVANDDASVDVELTGESEDRFTVSDMPVDEIIHIERVPYRGHVYDLQEASGLMVADGIITSNCRCGTAYVVD